MLTQIEKTNILSEFPNVKLSYENITHKKVYNSDYIEIIPEGKKCFAWFTNINNNNVCLIMELASNKQISNIKITNTCFSDDLAYGTILYGTSFYHYHNNFFCIEDIFSYKGDNIERETWNFKLCKIKQLLNNDIKQISYNNSFTVFGLPLICTNNDDFENKIKDISYKIDSIQFKLFNKVNNFLFMKYNSYISVKCEKPVYIQDKPKPAYVEDKPKPVFIEEKSKPVYKENVFLIKPDIQNDIYHLYCLNDKLKEEQCGIAHIADYNTSVMMNKLFRIIKENNNLDALEESDDEEEFENVNIDKFVHLNKSHKMICQFNHKFKKWVPVKLANESSKIISNNDLKYIYNLYDQNKKKNQYKK
jgi:hypothetical protein